VRAELLDEQSLAALESIAREATARYRFRALLIAAFAALALVLAPLGLFGVLAYTMQRRWRESIVGPAFRATRIDPVGALRSG
jgi:hypothetical protein